MKYIITEYPERHYLGLKRDVNLNKPEEMCIGELWTSFFKDFNKLPYTKGEMIGLELYPHDFQETKNFSYLALAPVDELTEMEEYESITLPAGKYVKVEITVQQLFDGVTPKVYEFLQQSELEIDYGFDYEEYPEQIDMSNTESVMYIVLKLKTH